MGIAYCDGHRLKRLFLAGSERVVAHRAELDRINVFPVPDGDTGTNLALTFRAMADALVGFREASVARVASRLAEAGVLSARGNSGMMMSHFFLGFADGLADRERARPEDFADAMRQASDSLYQAVDNPVEGTLLTVVRESTEEVERYAGEVANLEALARRALRAAQASLERTPLLLASLREARVVDAGAKGFVRFLEGIVHLVDGSRPMKPAGVEVRDAAAAAEFPAETDRDFQYCCEYILRGTDVPEQRALADAVREFGGSLIVTRASGVAKIHIHTNEPDRVARSLEALPVAVEAVKAEDMFAQHRRLQNRRRTRRVALVTDSTSDLPSEIIIEHDVTVVPLTVMFGDQAFRDQVDITHEEFCERLRDPRSPPATTSQPSPAQLSESFALAAEKADQVLGLFVGRALSGTYGQAQAVAARFAGSDVRVFDSRSGSLGLGFQVLLAAELARGGWDVDELIAELERVRARSGLLLTVDSLQYLKRSGRVGRARAFLGGLLDLKPILSLDADGVVVPVDKARGREALISRVIEIVRERVAGDRSRLRLGVAHVDCPTTADRLARAFVRELAPDELMVRPAAPVLAAHTGPGAFAVFWQVE